MAQGVKIELSVDEVADAIERNNGVVTMVMSELGISNFWLYDFFKKHPELWDTLHNARKKFNRYKRHNTCEASISVLEKLMQLVDEHPTQALKAAMFNLENLGDDFGYGKKLNDQIEIPTLSKMKNDEVSQKLLSSDG